MCSAFCTLKGWYAKLGTYDTLMEIYCSVCKEKRQPKDLREITLDNGKPAEEGTCPVCGTKLFAIVFPNACQ